MRLIVVRLLINGQIFSIRQFSDRLSDNLALRNEILARSDSRKLPFAHEGLRQPLQGNALCHRGHAGASTQLHLTALALA